MKKERWDLFFSGFSAPHCIGHHFWQYIDQSHPRHDPLDPHKLNDAIEVIYRAVDDEIAKMLMLAGSDVQCLIVAGHGMGPLYHASWNLNEILNLLGYGHVPKKTGTTQRSRYAQINLWRLLRMVLPGTWQYAIKEALPRRLQDEIVFRWYAGDRNWAGRRAFAVPNNDSVGAIRINVLGRDKYGIVQPGEEYERLCHEIANALHEIIDPASGRKVVERVTFAHQQFHGAYLSLLPDLMVLWDQSFPWNSIQSFRLGTLHLRRQDSRSGSHSAHGFLLINGPGVPAGFGICGHSIYDFCTNCASACRGADSHSLWTEGLSIYQEVSRNEGPGNRCRTTSTSTDYVAICSSARFCSRPRFSVLKEIHTPWTVLPFFRHRLSQACAKQNYETCRHSLRHSAASRGVMAGVDFFSIEENSWSSRHTTLH
jgi:predicted AlkP superfamily phosphohydrolase/phosphomutase